MATTDCQGFSAPTWQQKRSDQSEKNPTATQQTTPKKSPEIGNIDPKDLDYQKNFQLRWKAENAEREEQFSQAYRLRLAQLNDCDGKFEKQHRFFEKFEILDNLHWLSICLGDFEKAIDFSRQRLTLAREMGFTKSLPTCLEKEIELVKELSVLPEDKRKLVSEIARVYRKARLRYYLAERGELEKSARELNAIVARLDDLFDSHHPFRIRIEGIHCQALAMLSISKSVPRYKRLMEKWDSNDPQRQLALIELAQHASYFFGRTGKVELSVQLAEYSGQKSKTVFENRPTPEQAFASQQIAVMSIAKGNVAEALRFAEQAELAYAITNGRFSLPFVESVALLSELYFHYKQFDRSIKSMRMAEKLLDQYDSDAFIFMYEVRYRKIGLKRIRFRLLENQKKYKDALAVVTDAETLTREYYGEKSSDYAQLLREKSQLQSLVGLHEEGIENAKKALNIIKTHGGTKDLPAIPYFLLCLGRCYEYDGQHDQAIAIYEKSIARERALAVNSFKAASTEYQIGTLKVIQKDPTCKQNFERAANEMIDRSSGHLAVLDESLAIRYTHRMKNALGGILLGEQLQEHPDYHRYLEYLWVVKGSAVHTLATRVQLLNELDDPKLRKEFTVLSRRMSQLSLKPKFDAAVMDALTKEKTRLLSKLHQANPNIIFGVDREKAKKEIEEFAAKLPADTAVIDIIEHLVPSLPEGGKGKSKVNPQFFATIIRQSKDPKTSLQITVIKLGEFHELEELIEAFRHQVIAETLSYLNKRHPKFVVRTPPDFKRSSKKKPNGDPAELLRKKVWNKLEPKLDGIKNVIICPDGNFSKLPWAALPGKKNTGYLANQYAFIQSTTPRQIWMDLNKSNDIPTRRSLLTISGLPYANVQEATVEKDMTLVERLLDRKRLKNLPGSDREAQMLSDKISALDENWTVKQLRGKAGTEVAFRDEMTRHGIIHIAAHGFVISPETIKIAFRDAKTPKEKNAIQQFYEIFKRNPFAVTGIVLYRPDRPDLEDDGLATAAELLTSDLRNVDLIVLSSCGSSLGTINPADAVYSLQTAFGVAGARSRLASIFNVNDDFAIQFMDHFYDGILKKRVGNARAIQQAQLKMIEAGLPPGLWANWVLQGQWN